MTVVRTARQSSYAPPDPSTAPIDAPLNPDVRFTHLDVLRGFALFGMLMVHLTYYAKGSGRVHDLMLSSVNYAFETKFFALFAFLFGVSFAVQMTRANSRGAPFVRLYVRRLIGLGVIGMTIKLVFDFNVLTFYAVWGMALLLVRNLSRRWILALLAFCMLSLSVWRVATGIEYLLREGSVARAEMALTRDGRARAAAFEDNFKQKKGPYLQAVRARAQHMRLMMTQRFFWRPTMDLLGLFLLGLLAVRSGVAQRPHEHRRIIARFMAVGAGLFVLSLFIEHLHLTDTYDLGYKPWTGAVSGLLGIPEQFYLMFLYAGAVVLWGLSALAPLGWTGRMALTSYVVQLVFLEGVLGSHGFGTGIPTWSIPIVCVAFIAVQVLISKWWLTRYRFGPVEWLWRSFTYAAIQPMRRPVATTAAV
jgi:uncharacterized protein